MELPECYSWEVPYGRNVWIEHTLWTEGEALGPWSAPSSGQLAKAGLHLVCWSSVPSEDSASKHIQPVFPLAEHPSGVTTP